MRGTLATWRSWGLTQPRLFLCPLGFRESELSSNLEAATPTAVLPFANLNTPRRLIHPLIERPRHRTGAKRR